MGKLSASVVIRLQAGLIVGLMLMIMGTTTWITQREISGSLRMISELAGEVASQVRFE
jgi:hypothetical protein